MHAWGIIESFLRNEFTFGNLITHADATWTISNEGGSRLGLCGNDHMTIFPRRACLTATRSPVSSLFVTTIYLHFAIHKKPSWTHQRIIQDHLEAGLPRLTTLIPKYGNGHSPTIRSLNASFETSLRWKNAMWKVKKIICKYCKGVFELTKMYRLRLLLARSCAL